MRSFARLPLLIGILAAATPALGQTTYTWGANAGTAWATGGNWVGGVAPGSSTDPANNDIAQWGAGSTGTQIQMNFGNLGTPFYVGSLNLLSSNTVAKTMGANTATAGVVQLNGTGPTNLILSNASASLFTLAPLAGGSGTGMSLRLGATNSEISATGGITISAAIAEAAGGAKGITKTGTGTLTLSGANTFTGGVTLNGGAVNFTGNSAFGTGTITVGTGAVSQVGFAGSPGAAFLNNTSNANTTVGNNIVLASPAAQATYTLQKTGSGGQLNLTGNISGGNANTKLFFQTSVSGDNTTTFRLAGNNTFVAQMELWRGGLVIGSTTGLGVASNLLRLNPNNNTAFGDVRFEVGGTFANPIQFLSATAISAGANEVVLSGDLSGTTAWQVIGTAGGGTGSLSLSGANNTNSGAITVQTGATLRVGAGGSTGTLGTAGVTNNGTLAFNRSDALTVGNVIAGTGAVNQIGPGTTTLTAANTFSGPLNVTAGTLALGATGSVATNTINVGSGGVLDVSAVFGYTLASGKTLTVGRTGAAAPDVIGDVTLAGTLNVGGSGAFRTATFGNGLTLNDATVAFDLGAAITPGGGVNDLVAVAGGLTLSGTNTINITQPASGLANGNYTLFTYGGTLTGNASNLSLGGAASGTTRQVFNFDTASAVGSVLLNVSGSPATLTWTGGNNSNWDLVTTANNFSGAADSRFYNLDTVTFNDSAATGNVTLVGSLNPTSTTVNNNSLTYTFGGAGGIGGNGGLTKSGTGTLVLSTNNTYSGGTTITAGTLQLGSGGTVGGVAGDVTNNGTLAFNRSDAVTFSSVVSGSGNLVQSGTGTTILTATNTYAGTTTVTAGTLQVGNGGTVGTLGAGAVTTNATLAFNRSDAVTVANVIGGTGSVSQLGSGTLTLDGANTYSGGTSVTAGAVNFTNGSAFGTGTITFGAGVVNSSGLATSPPSPFLNNTTAANTTLANNIVLMSPAVATTYAIQKTGSGGQINFTGDISGGNANTKLFLNSSVGGDNTTTYRFAGNNTFVATVEVWRGAVVVASANALGDASNLIRFNSNNNTALGDLRFDASVTLANPIEFVGGGGGPVNTNGNAVTLTGVLSGSYAGGLTKLGAGSLTVTGANTYTAGTTVSAGTLNVSNASGSGTGAGAVTVNAGATLGGTGTIAGAVTVNAGSGGTAGGTIRGDAGAGTGNLALGGATTVNGAAAAANAATLATQLTVNASGTVTGNSKLALGFGTLNFNTAAGAFNIRLANDGGLTPDSAYSLILATATVNGYQKNGLPWEIGTNEFLPSDFNVISGSGAYTFSNTSLTVDGSNNLVLTFTPVPEPLTVLAVGAAGLGLVGVVRRRRVRAE